MTVCSIRAHHVSVAEFLLTNFFSVVDEDISKTEDEIGLMRRANQLVGKTLGELAKHIKPGVTTLQLDKIADEFIRDHGAVPTFKNFPNPYGAPFPASICTSVLWCMECQAMKTY